MASAASLRLGLGELEATFESIGEAIIIVNKQGRIIRANHVALEMLGYKKSELLGEWPFAKIRALNVDSKELPPLEWPVVKAIVSGGPVYEYLYYLRKNNSRVPVFTSSSPIMVNGQPIGVISIFRDISMEEAVDQMKSEFISLASHQLRTPLSSIKTYSHMLLDGYMGKLNEDNRPALEIIVAATNRMNELISTLLNITRLESGAIVVEATELDVMAIAREVINDMDIPAKNRNIKLKLTSEDQRPTDLVSDGPIIKEVLTNLVSNSIKYSLEGGQVKISVLGGLNSITITVADNGLGIPKPARDQIFTKFFRAHNVIQSETNGTGLGLYLVKGLVDELGGKISFKSVEGKGTTFTVRLPRKISAN